MHGKLIAWSRCFREQIDRNFMSRPSIRGLAPAWEFVIRSDFNKTFIKSSPIKCSTINITLRILLKIRRLISNVLQRKSDNGIPLFLNYSIMEITPGLRCSIAGTSRYLFLIISTYPTISQTSSHPFTKANKMASNVTKCR